MSEEKTLDKYDRKILVKLQEDARITNQRLAEEINLSPSACLQRLRRLEQEGYFNSYNAKLNLDRVARHISCIATITLKNHAQEDFDAFEQMVDEIPEIVECYTVSGEFDFFLKVVCPDMAHYLKINDQLVRSGNYTVTIQTHVIMKENKAFRGVNLESLF